MKSMTRRIFIAINLPDDIKEKILKLPENWPHLPCRWVGKENLHLTLIFLGYVRPDKVDDIFQAVEKALENKAAFEIFFTKVCYGPGKELPPRLVWVEGEKSLELIDIKKGIESLISGKVPFIKEEREFLPHITLARINAWQWKKLDEENRKKINTQIFFRFPVKSIEVMESHLKRTGAEYEVLKSFVLK